MRRSLRALLLVPMLAGCAEPLPQVQERGTPQESEVQERGTPQESEAAAGCEIFLTHVGIEHYFDFQIRVTGLDPNTELLTIEFRRGDVVFATMSSQVRLQTFNGDIKLELESVALPPGNWEFVAEVTQPESCDATATSTRYCLLAGSVCARRQNGVLPQPEFGHDV